MNLDDLLGIDETDPESRHAGYVVDADAKLIADLVRFRKERGLTQRDVARSMGIDTSGVSKIESGYRDLLQSTIQRYAMAVGAVVKHAVVPFAQVDNPPAEDALRESPVTGGPITIRARKPGTYRASARTGHYEMSRIRTEAVAASFHLGHA